MTFTLTIPAFLLSDMTRGILYGFVGGYIVPFVILYIRAKISERKQYIAYMQNRYGDNWKDPEHRCIVEQEEYIKNKAEFKEYEDRFYNR